MNLEQLLGIFLMFTLFGVGIAALTVLCDVLFARVVRRARGIAAQRPFRSGIVGAINFLFFSVIAFVIFAIAQELENGGADVLAGLLRVFGVLFLLALSSFLALGVTASARWVGEKIAPDASAVRQIIFGISILALAFLAPLVGWFLVPLAAALVGYGAVIMALVRKKE